MQSGSRFADALQRAAPTPRPDRPATRRLVVVGRSLRTAARSGARATGVRGSSASAARRRHRRTRAAGAPRRAARAVHAAVVRCCWQSFPCSSEPCRRCAPDSDRNRRHRKGPEDEDDCSFDCTRGPTAGSDAGRPRPNTRSCCSARPRCPARGRLGDQWRRCRQDRSPVRPSARCSHRQALTGRDRGQAAVELALCLPLLFISCSASCSWWSIVRDQTGRAARRSRSGTGGGGRGNRPMQPHERAARRRVARPLIVSTESSARHRDGHRQSRHSHRCAVDRRAPSRHHCRQQKRPWCSNLHET